MISIQHSRIEKEIFFSNTQPFNLVIENASLLRKFITGITLQIESSDEFLRCYDGLKEIDVSKTLHFVYDCYFNSLDSKKTETFTQKDVIKHISDDQKDRFQNLVNQFSQLVKEISIDYPFPLDIESDITLNSIFKVFSLAPISEGESFIETFLLKVQILSYINKKKHFIFYNLHDFFSQEELFILQTELQKLEIEFITLSSHKSNKYFKNEQKIIIDDDLCELHIDVIEEND